MRRSLRASIKDAGIVVVAVHNIDGAVGLLRKRDIANEWPGRKMTLHICLKAIRLWCDAEKVANAALGLDLVCSDPHL